MTLAERLAERVPISGPVKAGFFNAGTEAVENAVKFARAYTEAPGDHRVRGRLPRPHADVALAHLEDAPVQGRARPVRARGLPRAVPVRLPRHHDRGRARRARARVHGAGRGRERRGDRVRAGAGRGRLRRPAASSSCRACGAICDEHGIVLVADEVQTGFGRTGRFFAHGALRRRARPGHGRQVDRRRACRSRACSAARRSWTRPTPGGVGGTYVGNPVAQAAALAVLDVIDEEGLVERSATIGETIRARMLALAGALARDRRRARPRLDARDRARLRPGHEEARARARRAPSSSAALERGLLLITCGIYGNCIRVLAPLVITDAELEEALGVWEEALEAALD